MPRFTAICSFLHFATFREPAALPVIQRVLAVPMKRFDRSSAFFLDPRCEPFSMPRTLQLFCSDHSPGHSHRE